MKYGPAITLVSGILSVVTLWWVFYLLWNYLMARVFYLPELTFWQSTGLLLMLSVVVHVVSNVVRGSK
jgi:hypothetical protein